MSHISRIKTQMIDKEYLLKAIHDLGYTIEQGDLEIGGFASEKMRVEIKIPLRLSSDIGFRATPTGYEVVADWWSVRGVKRDEFTNTLSQRYAYHVTRAKLEAQGFTLIEEASAEDGQIRLVLRRTA